MRIFLSSQSSAFGGVERRWIKEAQLLKAQSHDVYWSTPNFPGIDTFNAKMLEAGAKKINWNPYKYIERQQIYFPFQSLGYLHRNRIRKFNFDLAHVALNWTSVGMTRVRELCRAGVPTVISLRCTYPLEKYPKEVLNEIKHTLAGVRGAYAVSESARDSFLANFEKYCSHFKIDVIHNGVSYNTFSAEHNKSAIRKKLNIPLESYVIAFCARLEPLKRPHFLLDLLDSDELRTKNIHLLFIGSGPEENSLRARVSRSSIADRVIFTGLSNNVAELFGASDAYLSCSIQEGFPSTAAEALASGLPCFLTDELFFRVFSACEAVKLISRNDKSAWIDAIANAITPNLDHKSKISEVARNFAKTELDDNVMYKKLTSFYAQHLTKASPVIEPT